MMIIISTYRAQITTKCSNAQKAIIFQWFRVTYFQHANQRLVCKIACSLYTYAKTKFVGINKMFNNKQKRRQHMLQSYKIWKI